jgi:hypothetical protein
VNGTSVLDECGECGGNGIIPDGDCDCNGNVLDECHVCGGDNTTCADCAGTPNGTKFYDECGVCGGDNSACTDCAGVVNGNSKLDACGVCDGDNSTCTDCAGVVNGNSVQDKNGVCCVSEMLDACGLCNGPGIPDDACDCDGTAFDDCGVCGGDNECPEKQKDFVSWVGDEANTPMLAGRIVLKAVFEPPSPDTGVQQLTVLLKEGSQLADEQAFKEELADRLGIADAARIQITVSTIVAARVNEKRGSINRINVATAATGSEGNLEVKLDIMPASGASDWSLIVGLSVGAGVLVLFALAAPLLWKKLHSSSSQTRKDV